MQKTKYKVALVCICLNQPYWEYAKRMIESAQKFFLKNHEVDFILWSDMPETESYGALVIPTQPVEWPYPTLLRYDLYLNEEIRLREYDYVFHCDIDMLFVGDVGEEILGEGLTAAQHPMYALRTEYQAPLEPNPASTAYIKYPKYYYAGGFQGGRTNDFIQAMKVMKRNIEIDLNNNYIARWNDESHWNRYLFDVPPSVVLSPSYIYPDSLIQEYYIKVWGVEYPPKLMTITKKFSLSKEGADAIAKFLQTS